jgi:hypothetical protein
MNKNEILNDLRNQFEATRKKLGFKASYDEINRISYIEDMVLSEGYVSNQFSRQLINRMVETLYSWMNEIYSWIYPAPMDIVHMHENRKLNEQEKKEMLLAMDGIMYFVRKTKRIAFDGFKEKEESEIIDEVVDFYNIRFKPFMLKYHKRFEDLWKDEMTK